MFIAEYLFLFKESITWWLILKIESIYGTETGPDEKLLRIIYAAEYIKISKTFYK